ncbi:MAG: zinc-binding dehydrogenase [Candidatus Nitrosopolaris sp.]
MTIRKHFNCLKQTILLDLFFRRLNLIGATQGTRAGLEKVVKWTSKGKIKAIIDTVYLFEDMVMGHIKMMESRLFGKLITTPQKL